MERIHWGRTNQKCDQPVKMTRKKEDNQTDFRHFLSNDFLQRTAGKRRRINKFRDMGFFLKIPIYQNREGFAEKLNGLGDFWGALDTFFRSAASYEI